MPSEARSGDAGPIVGVLLAGGRARRMGGGDKCLLPIGSRTLLECVVARAAPQVDRLVLNAHGDATRFAAFGLPVVADVVPGFAGPLAGILSGLVWARESVPACRWVASFATDTPLIPPDLVARLGQAVATGADIACAASGGRTHPVFALWPIGLAAALRTALVDEGIHKIDAWTARYSVAHVEFASAPVDPFFNVNAPQDLDRAAALIAALIAAEGAP